MISHKSRQLYGSILLVILVILYYYYTRMHEGVTSTIPTKKTTTTTPTKTTTTTPTKTTTTAATTAANLEIARQKQQAEISNQIKYMQMWYSSVYGLLTDQHKKEMKKVYNHFIENIVKDDFLS